MLHRFGHGLLVILVACLCLMPARAEAATIDLTTVSPGSFEFSGLFDADNDIALIFIELLGTAVVSAEVTSHFDLDAGFDAMLTLYEPGAFDDLTENAFGFLDPVTLSAGIYVLAVSHFGNYYTLGGFDYAGAPSGALTAELGLGGTTCAFVGELGDCRSARFAGTLSLQGEGTVSVQPDDVVQPVPEPGTLALLMAGGAALLARRRRWKRSASSDVTEN